MRHRKARWSTDLLGNCHPTGAGSSVAGLVRWPPKTGQVAKRESQLGMAVWPKVRHGKYTEEAQS
jgi:hypothetical protein